MIAKLPLNVLGWRRFDSPDKQMRSICRAGKLWVKAGVGASEATDLASRNPVAAEWRRSVNRVLYAVCFYNSSFNIFNAPSLVLLSTLSDFEIISNAFKFKFSLNILFPVDAFVLIEFIA